MKALLYSPDELLSRPIEHTLEFLSSRELGRIIGCSPDSANDVLHHLRDLEEPEVRRVREWILTCPAARALGTREAVRA